MKVFLETIGCRLNQAEIESMAGQFRLAGHEIVAAAEGADLAVINTCSVTAAAASDSRARIRQVSRLGAAQIVATGCWATLEPSRAAAMVGVGRVVPNQHKDSLVSDLLGLPATEHGPTTLARRPLPGPHHRTRAFIKVQDGCDNACTFCITTVARGGSRSRPTAEVIADIQAALDGGTREVVLTGVHLGSWGRERGLHLRDLVKAILDRTDAPRVRLSSLEPWDLDADFFGLWQDARLCPHLHLPLQSGCTSTLRRMARKTTPATFRSLVAAARAAVPGVAITTDVIAGFPGETEADFHASLDFVRELDFSGGHAFAFSAMPGTPASRMRDQVPPEERKARSRRLIEALQESARRFRARNVGACRPVLWESSEEQGDGSWELRGLTDNYIRVHCRSRFRRWNEIDRVDLIGPARDGLEGMIVK